MSRLLVFKKGVCVHSDGERIRRAARLNLQNLIEVVCTDWDIPIVKTTFVNRPRADYLGQYTCTMVKGVIIDHLIEINSIAFWSCDSVTTSFFERSKLILTILHELAHYIEVLMYGRTGHSSRFADILDALVANNYPEKLTEVV
jgi:hypothetical protein